MENNFFIPIGKAVLIVDTLNKQHTGILQGFITFGGIPSIFLNDSYDDLNKLETIIPINQVVTFSVVKPKNILL
jgi:hypothetical protein